MGAFLFVYIPRQTKNVVRPSYDGQSLMSEDSVAKRRSVCQGGEKYDKRVRLVSVVV